MKEFNNLIKFAVFCLIIWVAPISAETTDNLRFSLVGGITLGGDEVASLRYSDGSTNNIYAGRLGYFGGGLEYDINKDVMLRLNAHYHWDTAVAANGDVRFSRYVFEVIPYYHLSDKYRVGLGLGLHTNTKLSSDFFADLGFDNANAVIASVGRKMSDSDHWLELRMVSVEYFLNKYNDYSLPPSAIFQAASGNHVGLAYHMLF